MAPFPVHDKGDAHFHASHPHGTRYSMGDATIFV